MKAFLTVLVLAGGMLAGPAWADKVCIDSRNIVASNSKDGRTMVFKMRDGRTYVNHLQGALPGLEVQWL